MINFNKKKFTAIINYFFLSLFLSAVFLPHFASAAGTLTITPSTGHPVVDQSFQLKVTTSPAKINVKIEFNSRSFSSLPTCVTGSDGSCSIPIKFSGPGTFTVRIVADGYTSVDSYPLTVSLGNLTMVAVPPNTQTGQDSRITVTTSDNTYGVNITFSGVNNTVLSSLTCTTYQDGSCSVTFNAKLALGETSKSFGINANADGYQGTSLNIDVSKDAPPPVPVVANCGPDKISYNGSCVDKPKSIYNLLAPLPCDKNTPYCVNGKLENFDTQDTNALWKYLNTMILIFIGIAAVLAVIMIIAGGLEYLTSELVHSKEAGKEKITNALLGLVIALGAYAILNTINPDLLSTKITLPEASFIDKSGDTNVGIVFNKNVLPSGIVCGGGQSNIPNIAQSFSGKMTYGFGTKGVPGPNNTISLDCSGFVNYVLQCAGVPYINAGTDGIFAGAEAVNSSSFSGTKINGKELQIGDLIGWRPGDSSNNNYGHVLIYIGNGQVADSHGGSGSGNALGIWPLSKYQSLIKYIKRAPAASSAGGGSGGGGGGGGR